MSMKPGATTLPAGVDRAFACGGGKIADGGDSAIANAEVSRVPRRAGAVDDVTVGDDEVEGRQASARTKRPSPAGRRSPAVMKRELFGIIPLYSPVFELPSS